MALLDPAPGGDARAPGERARRRLAAVARRDRRWSVPAGATWPAAFPLPAPTDATAAQAGADPYPAGWADLAAEAESPLVGPDEPAPGPGAGDRSSPEDPAVALRAAVAWPEAPPAPGAATRVRQFAREHLAVLLVVLAVGVTFAVVQATRSRAETVVPPAVVTASPGVSADASAPPSPSAPPTPALIKVHVLGAVAAPGVVSLPLGARVIDAIAAAGGLLPSADPGELNLAAVLTDGCQIVIGTTGHPQGAINGGGGTVSGGGTGAATLNLNTATGAQLEELPGVGPVTAGKILAWRAQHGHFSRIEELQEIDGIGPKTFAQIAPYVTV